MGVMDHNAVLESIEEGCNTRAEKYVDDLTVFEAIPTSRPYYRDDEDRLIYQAPESQRSMETIEETCEVKGLKINDKKTQVISISTRKKNGVWLKTKDGTVIKSSKKMKLLGFMFDENPNCNEQVTF